VLPESTGTVEARQRVIAWYSQKTRSILNKYGPGPRVHFHIGIFDGSSVPRGGTCDEIRQRLVASQEAMMYRVAEVWEAPRFLSGSVLDAGCGLGGGAIFWAQTLGAQVTAVTIVAEHIPIIRGFADQAGVADRVTPVLSDACMVKTAQPFDAAVAMESACYFPRRRWFARLARIIRPGGYVCVEDTFLGKKNWAEPFDAYWRTDVGPVEEYVEAAQRAGFELEKNVDVTRETSAFWLHSTAWSEAAMQSRQLDEFEEQRMPQSIRWHKSFYEAWEEGGIEVRLLRFRNGRS
jgi:tocopherol O-methyltransferase